MKAGEDLVNRLLSRIDELKMKIDGKRPLSQKEARELQSYYKIGLTYSSNALEGNSLTLTETKVLLEDGLTAGGKPIKDCNEALGHAKAFDLMMDIAGSEPLVVTEELICKLHYLFYNGIDDEQAGKYRTHQVIITGTDYLPPEPKKVPAEMANFITELEKKEKTLHPVLFAAFAHRRFVDIHPFCDGNGRTARLLMNLILVNKGYSIVSIPPVLRHQYIGALKIAQRANNPNDEKFNELICECEIEAQKDFCRLFHIPLKNVSDLGER